MGPPQGNRRRPPPEGTFVIDGYNLLRRGFIFREGEELAGAREKLEVRLREFRRTAPGACIILIYDGAREVSWPLGSPRSDPGFRILFSLPPMTADEAVIDESRRLSGKSPITVVTSDEKDIGRRVRGLGIRHMTSEEFVEILDAAMERPRLAGEEAQSPPRPTGEKPSPEEIPAEEVAEWIKIFSSPKPPRGPGRKRPG